MATYKLTYFNIKGLGELAKYVFVQAGVQYEDNRISKEDWPQLKPKTPFGILPVLEEDGKEVAGGRVIARYLAEKFGLAGSNSLENAQIASVADFLDDLQQQFGRMHMEKDEDRKAAMAKEFQEVGVPKYFGTLQKRLQNNNGFLWGGKLTWVDLYFFGLLDFVYDRFQELFKAQFPEIAEFKERIETLPNIAKHIKERPY